MYSFVYELIHGCIGFKGCLDVEFLGQYHFTLFIKYTHSQSHAHAQTQNHNTCKLVSPDIFSDIQIPFV